MNRLFPQYRSLVLARSVIAALLGILALIWPIIIITFSVILLGVYILVDGIFSMINAIRKRKITAHWDLQFVSGMFGILAGVLTFFNPFVIVAAVVFLIVT